MKNIIKKSSLILLSVIAFFIFATLTASAESKCIRGDADGDGRVTIRDVTLIQKKLSQMEISYFNEEAADVDKNGLKINDVTLIQRYLADFENFFRIGELLDNDSHLKPSYYSSLSLAVSDANNLSTLQSDVADEGDAAVSLLIDDDLAYITLLCDNTIDTNIKINSKTNIDLNNYSLIFTGSNNITFAYDLTISNGHIIADVQNIFIVQERESKECELYLNDCLLDIAFDGSSSTKKLSVISSANCSINLERTSINTKIVNNKESQEYSLLSETYSSNTHIVDCEFKISSEEIITGDIYGLVLTGKSQFLSSRLEIDTHVSNNGVKRLYGLFGSGEIISKNSTIIINATTSGTGRRINAAIINADDSGNSITRLDDLNIAINYNTQNTYIERTYAVMLPYGGVASVENSNISINTVAIGTNLEASKYIIGIQAGGDGDLSLTTNNNNINLDCHLTAERTDSTAKIYQIGYNINSAALTSTSDIINCTTDTIYNNVIRSYAMQISKSPSTEIDNIYAFVTSQPSYVETSDGATPCIRILNSTVNITDNNGDNYVHGSFSGITAGGEDTHLTIHGGTYESPAHGGIYFMGAINSTFDVDRIKSLNTQNFNEYFDQELLQSIGALYVNDFGCTANITNSYIYGGNFGLRIKYYDSPSNTAHHADVNIENTYIYGNNVGIHDDLFPETGVLTICENTVIEIGGLDPEHAFDVWTWRGADVVDKRPNSSANDLSRCEKEDVTYNVENSDVQEFLASTDYNASDYNYTNFNMDILEKYAEELAQEDSTVDGSDEVESSAEKEPTNVSEEDEEDDEQPEIRLDRPAGADIDVPENSAKIIFTDKETNLRWSGRIMGDTYTINNLLPGHTYDYLVLDNENKAVKYGTVTATGKVRMISGGEGTFNIRDLGGWRADGGTLKYGLIYRGCELNGESYEVVLDNYHKNYFKNVLGVQSEIDLRSYTEIQGVNGSAFGNGVEYNHYLFPAYSTGLDLQGVYTENLRDIIKKIAHNVNDNKPTYCHCLAGADRTGTVMFLVEALCGVSQSDIDKDYELTSFSKGFERLRTNERYRSLVNYIEKMEGTTLQEKVVNYALKIGVSIDEINMLRNGLIDGTPAKL